MVPFERGIPGASYQVMLAAFDPLYGSTHIWDTKITVIFCIYLTLYILCIYIVTNSLQILYNLTGRRTKEQNGLVTEPGGSAWRASSTLIFIKDYTRIFVLQTHGAFCSGHQIYIVILQLMPMWIGKAQFSATLTSRETAWFSKPRLTKFTLTFQTDRLQSSEVIVNL